LGSTVYPTYGFIYQSTTSAARQAAQGAVRTVAQNAVSTLAQAAQPGGGPSQMLSQAASAPDRIAALIQSVTSGSDKQ
jgi:hypothetical protein